MGLSIEELLFSYFGMNELKDALDEIGKPVSGTKAELVKRIISSWESRNRNIYDLLEYVEDDYLVMICEDFNLPSDGNTDTLKRRIKRARLLDSDSVVNRKNTSTTETPRPTAEEFNRVRNMSDVSDIKGHSSGRNVSKGSEDHTKLNFLYTKKAWLLALIIPVIFGGIYQDVIITTLFPPSPSIVVEINAQYGIIEKNEAVLEYQPTSIPSDGTIPETFFVTIMNRGNSDAHNFSIVPIITPKTSNWLDYQNTKVVSSGLPPVCKTKSSQCTMDIIPRDGTIRLDYQVSIDPKEYDIIKLENPKIVFEYNYDELSNPKQVEVNIVIASH